MAPHGFKLQAQDPSRLVSFEVGSHQIAIHFLSKRWIFTPIQEAVLCAHPQTGSIYVGIDN